MQPESGQLLRAIADLAAHAQSRPTDSKGIARLRKARVAAETAWINAGCPDAAPGKGKPMKVPRADRSREAEDILKDWTPVTLTLTVKSLSANGGALVTDDYTEAWVPCKLCWEVGTRDLVDLEEAEMYDLDMPAWLVKEKKFNV